MDINPVMCLCLFHWFICLTTVDCCFRLLQRLEGEVLCQLSSVTHITSYVGDLHEGPS